MSGNTAYIDGIAIWSTRLPGWDSAQRILRGEIAAPDDTPARPTPTLLPPNERRRAPDTVAVSMEVASEACTHAGRDPAALPSVFASTNGDLAITDYLCDALLHAPTSISPTKFHNSVHNTAAGYWGIATGCMASYTALSAGHHTFGNGMLEALLQMHSDDTDILYVAYDTAAHGPLATISTSTGRLGCALVLSPNCSANSKMMLNWRALEEDSPRDSDASKKNASLVAGNAMASSLALFECLASTGGRITCVVSPRLILDLSVTPLGDNARGVN